MTNTDSSTQWCCLARHVILPGSADFVHPANPNMYWYYVIWTVEMVERDVKYRRACFHVFSCTMPLIDRQNAFPMLARTNCRAASSGDEDLVIRGQRTEARFRTHMGSSGSESRADGEHGYWSILTMTDESYELVPCSQVEFWAKSLSRAHVHSFAGSNPRAGLRTQMHKARRVPQDLSRL